MTAEITPTEGTAPVLPARATVAGEVRAELARKRMTGRELSRLTGKSQPYWSRRLTGEVALDVDDLEAVGRLLDVPVSTFFRGLIANSYLDGTAGETVGHRVAVPTLSRSDLGLAA